MHPQALSSLARSVQPLVFETDLPEFPYTIWGTTFFVGYKRRAFILTTRHTLRPESIGPLCIFPSDTSRRMLPLKDVFFVPQADVDDDFADLAVIEIDQARLQHPEFAEATLIDLEKAGGDWHSARDDAAFVVMGYPEEHSTIDYENGEMTTGRIVLHGRYQKESALPYLHELKIADGHGLSTFSGFSGGPVFSWHEQPEGAARVCLCGMAIRGTVTSSIIHFLDRSVLLDALELKTRRPPATAHS